MIQVEKRVFASVFFCFFAFIGPSFGEPLPLGCTAKPEIPADSPLEPANFDLFKKRLIYYRCTDYDRDLTKVIDEALTWVKVRAPEVRSLGQKPAIVLDIDETSLSNWIRIYRDQFGYFSEGECDLSDDSKPCGDRAWQRSGEATAIVSTLKLYKFARCIDEMPPCIPIDVYFVTGRRENGAPLLEKTPREWTRDNLISAGYSDVTDDHLVLRPDFGGGVADYKSKARENIENIYGVTIIANIGDQMSDLEGGHAERSFKLPNPFYFIPSR